MCEINLISLPPKSIIGYRKNGKPIYNIAGGSGPLGNEGLDNPDAPTYSGGEPQGTGAGINPNWNEYLQDVPQELHEKVIPAFQAWDKGFQAQVQKVHSQYEPWKDVINTAGDPQYAAQAVNILRHMESNPEYVYQQLKEYFGFDKDTPDPSKPNGQGQQEPVDTVDPTIANLQRQNQLMIEYLQAERQQKLEAEQEALLDKDMANAKSKYQVTDPFFDEFVMAKLTANPQMSVDDAAQQFMSWAEKAASVHRPRPLIMGGGGGIPGQNVDVRKMDDKGTKDLIVQMLEAHNRQQ